MKLNFYDQQHIQRMFVEEERINAIFDKFAKLVSIELRKWNDSGNRQNVWVRNSQIEKSIERILLQLKSALENEIITKQGDAWTSAIDKNDKLVEKYIQGMSLSSIVKEGMFKRNLDALSALQKRVDNGLDLSKRVWNIMVQTKSHIELFLESGLSTGRSAEAIGRDFRQLLREPNKRFRRVRDEAGKLVLSQPMKNYNPGQGVYRSSRMNAVRLASTEINRGYRESDCERWKQLDFVLGFEVMRSRNGHPCAVCDALVGKYPKDFIFPGWHPFCICIAVPIVMNHDDFADYLLTDKLPEEKYIKTIPANAGKWMNSYIAKHPNNLPLFYKPNLSLIQQG